MRSDITLFAYILLVVPTIIFAQGQNEREVMRAIARHSLIAPPMHLVKIDTVDYVQYTYSEFGSFIGALSMYRPSCNGVSRWGASLGMYGVVIHHTRKINTDGNGDWFLNIDLSIIPDQTQLVNLGSVGSISVATQLAKKWRGLSNLEAGWLWHRGVIQDVFPSIPRTRQAFLSTQSHYAITSSLAFKVKGGLALSVLRYRPDERYYELNGRHQYVDWRRDDEENYKWERRGGFSISLAIAYTP